MRFKKFCARYRFVLETFQRAFATLLSIMSCWPCHYLLPIRIHIYTLELSQEDVPNHVSQCDSSNEYDYTNYGSTRGGTVRSSTLWRDSTIHQIPCEGRQYMVLLESCARSNQREAYIHEAFGLIAASVRIISHSILVVPIKGPTDMWNKATK
jgi:hypothetical protein